MQIFEVSRDGSGLIGEVRSVRYSGIVAEGAGGPVSDSVQPGLTTGSEQKQGKWPKDQTHAVKLLPLDETGGKNAARL